MYKYIYTYIHTHTYIYIHTYMYVSGRACGQKGRRAPVLYLLLLFLIGRQDVIIGCAFSFGITMAKDGNMLGKPWATTLLVS